MDFFSMHFEKKYFIDINTHNLAYLLFIVRIWLMQLWKPASSRLQVNVPFWVWRPEAAEIQKKWVSGKESICQWRDTEVGWISGSGRYPVGGNGNLLQYSCLENSMDWGAWQAAVYGVAKSWTQLSTHTHTHTIWFTLLTQVNCYAHPKTLSERHPE